MSSSGDGLPTYAAVDVSKKKKHKATQPPASPDQIDQHTTLEMYSVVDKSKKKSEEN